MSFSIRIKVENGTTVLEGATSGECAPPDGEYVVSGRKYSGPGSACDYILINTPVLTANASAPYPDEE